MEAEVLMTERLRRLSVGERAVLRRAAGLPLSMADGRALQALFHALPPGTRTDAQGKWFTALSIACLWDVDEARVGAGFPRMLRAYSLSMGNDSLDTRVSKLLDLRWDDDGYLAGKLARLARMLRSDDRGTMPDMDQFLKDLLLWNSDSRSVQLRWANEFYLSKEEEKSDVD